MLLLFVLERLVRRSDLRHLFLPSVFFDQFLTDDIPLDLIRPFIDLKDFRIPHHLLNRIISHIPIASEDLNRIGRHLHGHIAGKDFGHSGDFRNLLGIF